MLKRSKIFVLVALLGLSIPARAQFATFDASNLAQAILSFLQDGDNMVMNTEQFLQNLGMMEEQLEFLKKADKRYREVRADLWKAQEVIRIANNYEMTLKMFSNYVSRMKALSDEEIQYYQVRSAINEGFQYLLLASREVKRAREYLDSKSELSEDERRRGLEACDKSVSRMNSSMYSYIVDKYDDIDKGRIINANLNAMREAYELH